MKKFLTISFLFFIFSYSIHATETYTVKDGKWSDASIWANGVVPSANDLINIKHEVVRNEDLELNGTSLTIENNAKLTVDGKCNLKGFSNLVIDESGVLRCAGFKTYTTAGFIDVFGKLECVNVEGVREDISLGGTTTVSLDGILLAKNLKLSGNISLRAENGQIETEADLLIYGSSNLVALDTDLAVGGSLHLRSDWDLYLYDCKVTIAENYRGENNHTTEIHKGQMIVGGTFLASGEHTTQLSDRAKLNSDAVKLSNNTTILGFGKGGILQCREIELVDQANVRCAGEGCHYDRANYPEVPTVLDLGAGLNSTDQELDVRLGFGRTGSVRVKAYPNPVANVLTVEGLETIQQPEILLTNTMGHTTELSFAGEQTAVFQMRDRFAPGIYALTIKGLEKTETIQLMIQ